jgi:hypothetical protein
LRHPGGAAVTPGAGNTDNMRRLDRFRAPDTGATLRACVEAGRPSKYRRRWTVQRITKYGLAAAITILGLTACADSLSPPPPRSAPSPAFDAGDPSWFCQPCAPGLICAAVCLPGAPIVIVDPVPDDVVIVSPGATHER